MSQTSFASSGLLFNITNDLSTLTINTTIPNKTYSSAGIKINTAGYSLSNPGIDCSPAANGYCLFSVSNTNSKTITITGSAGPVNLTLCLNGLGPISCQNYTANLSQNLIPVAEGSFEKATLSANGWITAIQPGSSGSFLIYNSAATTTPLSGFPILSPPPCALKAAISDETAPSSVLIYRDVFLPNLPSNYKYTLSFKVGAENHASDYISPQSLLLSVPNQQARVDVIKPTSDPFTMISGDILLNAFNTPPGSPLVIPYNEVTVDLPSDLMNQIIRIRFAQVGNQYYFQLYADCVTLIAQPT